MRQLWRRGPPTPSAPEWHGVDDGKAPDSEPGIATDERSAGKQLTIYGVIRPFPAASMLTGMLANALGLAPRWNGSGTRSLQDRLGLRSPHRPGTCDGLRYD